MVLFHLQMRTVSAASVLKRVLKQVPEHLNRTPVRKTVKVKHKVQEKNPR